jgi:hypothetical protein
MLTESKVRQFAGAWLRAIEFARSRRRHVPLWSEIVLTSQVAARLLNDRSGAVTGAAS